MTEPIYHIATSADWGEGQASGLYQPESLHSEGFIHCSAREQVISTWLRSPAEQPGDSPPSTQL